MVKKKLLIIVASICLVIGLGCMGIIALANGTEDIETETISVNGEDEVLSDSAIEELAKIENTEDLTGNKVIIYYVGYSTPYIHYRIDGGSWTQSPGVAMQKSYVWYNYGFRYRAVIDLGEATSLTACFNDGAGNWDSNGGANYTFKAGTYGCNNGVVVQYDGDIVMPDYVDSTTIYYKGFANPYAHYQVEGKWTNSPGVAMEETSELEGYDYKIVIDNVYYDYAIVCFNDGSNNWDSNGGSNYKVGKGTYTFSDGKFTQINEVKAGLKISLDPSAARAAYAESPIIANFAGGVGPYDVEIGFENSCSDGEKYTYSNHYTKSKGSTECVGYFSFAFYGPVRFYANVTDSEGQYAECEVFYSIPEFELTQITTSLTSPQLKNTAITLGTKYINNYSDKAHSVPSENFTITKKGSTDSVSLHNVTSTNKSPVWTPTEAGVYDIHVEARSLDCIKTMDMEYVIYDEWPDDPEPKNTVTIYYSGYKTSYIHYKVDDGKWTTAPGEKMQKSDRAGFTHMYVVDLGENGSRVTACFNNGAGVWDNNSGNNYSFKAGVFGVTYSKVVNLLQPNIENVVTIYYRGYCNPYIHYKIGDGSWTTAPGVKMEACTDVDEYYYKAEINLGEADYLTACFNDGNGNWDSNNGSNYVFYIGTYLYAGGTIIEKN